MQSSRVPRLFLSALFYCITLELSLQAHTALHVTYGEMITNYYASCLANLSITHTNTKAHTDLAHRAFRLLGLNGRLAEVLLTSISTCSVATASDPIHLGCQWRGSKDKCCLFYKDVSLSQGNLSFHVQNKQYADIVRVHCNHLPVTLIFMNNLCHFMRKLEHMWDTFSYSEIHY